jgi:hypothetical protein
MLVIVDESRDVHGHQLQGTELYYALFHYFAYEEVRSLEINIPT